MADIKCKQFITYVTVLHEVSASKKLELFALADKLDDWIARVDNVPIPKEAVVRAFHNMLDEALQLDEMLKGITIAYAIGSLMGSDPKQDLN